jgi:plastocyanin domain-containing protein
VNEDEGRRMLKIGEVSKRSGVGIEALRFYENTNMDTLVALGTGAARADSGGVQVVDVTVKGGYQPAAILAEAGRTLRLNFTRREATPCGEEVVLPEFGKRAHLPEGSPVAVEVTPAGPGVYEFTCGMNMYKGKIIVR